MQRYYFFHITDKDYKGQIHGYWDSQLANSKKEIKDFYNPKGRQYANPVTKVYTEEQARQLAKTDRNLLDLMKDYESKK